MAIRNVNTYSDINRIHSPGVNSDLLVDDQAVKSQIFNILGTIPGERVMEPTFGSRLNLMLFEPVDRITGEAIKREVFGSLETWLPRIKVDRNLSRVAPSEEGFIISLVYRIILLNTIGTYDLLLSK